MQEHPVSINPSPQLPVLQTTQAASAQQPVSASSQQEQQPPWLLCAQRCDIDIWQLAKAKPQGQVGPPSEGALLPLATAPEHLLRLVAQSGRHVSTAAISQDRQWLAYSDSHRVSCFALEQQPADEAMPDDHVVPAPLQVPADLPAACHLAFRPGTSELVACASDGTLRIVQVAALPAVGKGKVRSGGGSSSGGASSDGLAPLRALHDLQYKSSFRRDRQRNAARRLMPLVELMAISPDGRCAALASALAWLPELQLPACTRVAPLCRVAVCISPLLPLSIMIVANQSVQAQHIQARHQCG